MVRAVGSARSARLTDKSPKVLIRMPEDLYRGWRSLPQTDRRKLADMFREMVEAYIKSGGVPALNAGELIESLRLCMEQRNVAVYEADRVKHMLDACRDRVRELEAELGRCRSRVRFLESRASGLSRAMDEMYRDLERARERLAEVERLEKARMILCSHAHELRLGPGEEAIVKDLCS